MSGGWLDSLRVWWRGLTAPAAEPGSAWDERWSWIGRLSLDDGFGRLVRPPAPGLEDRDVTRPRQAAPASDDRA